MEGIAQSTGVITVETFAAHVGAMVGVPVLSFWSGVTDYRQWQPLGKLVQVMRHPVPCAPCFKPCEGMECMRHDVVKGLAQAFQGAFGRPEGLQMVGGLKSGRLPIFDVATKESTCVSRVS